MPCRQHNEHLDIFTPSPKTRYSDGMTLQVTINTKLHMRQGIFIPSFREGMQANLTLAFAL